MLNIPLPLSVTFLATTSHFLRNWHNHIAHQWISLRHIFGKLTRWDVLSPVKTSPTLPSRQPRIFLDTPITSLLVRTFFLSIHFRKKNFISAMYAIIYLSFFPLMPTFPWYLSHYSSKNKANIYNQISISKRHHWFALSF